MEDDKVGLSALVWSEAEQCAKQGDIGYVRELGSQLVNRHAVALNQAREYERHLAHVVRVLALTPGRDSLVQLLQLLDDERLASAHPGLRPRFVASLLAEHQQVTDLAATVFGSGAQDRRGELRACLFHELVLRGVDVDAVAPLHSWALEKPGWHALACLPRHRSSIERGADFPSRSLFGSAGGVSPRLPAEGRRDVPTPRTTERSTLRDIATVDVHETIVAAVEAGGWGESGAWVFLLDEAITPDRVSALLPTLPMPCVDGLGSTGRFEVVIRPVDEIWHLLFATASMGGVYSSGVQGAYGRLWAWKSIAGLSGAPTDASAEVVERHARQCTWFHFEADTDWFHNDVGADYGIAALSPCCRRIAVLAATDTD